MVYVESPKLPPIVHVRRRQDYHPESTGMRVKYFTQRLLPTECPTPANATGGRECQRLRCRTASNGHAARLTSCGAGSWSACGAFCGLTSGDLFQTFSFPHNPPGGFANQNGPRSQISSRLSSSHNLLMVTILGVARQAEARQDEPLLAFLRFYPLTATGYPVECGLPAERAFPPSE